MKSSQWQKLIELTLATQEDEIDCQQCFQLLDAYTDILLDGGSPGQLLPMVEQHLQQCSGCSDEFDALLTIAQAGRGDQRSIALPGG